jgi:CheY-like chemotaxis protein
MEESESSLAFLRDLLHELKDPFAAVYGGLELTGRASPLTGPERDRLEISLRRNSQAMRRVLEDASLYLRLASGGLSSTRTAVDAESVLRQAAEASRPQLETRSQTVTVQGASLSMMVDTEALRRCITCMIGSVSRISPHGETLELCLLPASEGLLEVRLSVPGRESRQEAPPGPGESDGRLRDFRERVIDHLAAMLGGSARRSSLDTWSLVVPFEPAQISSASRATAASSNRPRKVLVVDDNRDGADTLSMWLEAKGYEVVTAYDGDHGIERFIAERPDIGLFDVGLPGRNGYELARAVRSTGVGCTLVAITGYGQEQDRAEAREAGFDHHMVKPVDLPALGTLLEGCRAPRVLVVEDNPVAREVLILMLRQMGARVTGAGTAEEGLEIVKREPLDLVICDLGLPGELDGCALARLIRRDGQARFSLVALTGDAKAAQDEALRAGFDQILEKPADRAALRLLLGL